MLAAGGVVALSTRPETGVVVLVVCVVGAVSTIAAGCWRSAKVVARGHAGSAFAVWAPSLRGDCGGACATCTLSCN